MLLKEQVQVVAKGLPRGGSSKVFWENAKALMSEGFSKIDAYALAYAVMKKEESTVRCLGRFLREEEIEDAGVYSKYLESSEERGMTFDPLEELRALDSRGGARPLMEQRPAVAAVMQAIEGDLKKAALVSLARMMREMGYERWPEDQEGREDIQRVIDAVAREMVKLGRRFSSLTKDQMRILKNQGPKNYERIVRKWLSGEPEGAEHEGPTMEDGEEKPEEEPKPSERNQDDTGKDIDPKDEPKDEPKAEEKENNPFAICTAAVGRDDKDKYERCVQDVKKKTGQK